MSKRHTKQHYLVAAIHSDGTRTLMCHNTQSGAISHMQELLARGAQDVQMYEEAPIYDAKTVLQARRNGAVQPV